MCSRGAAPDATKLRRAGPVKILTLTSPTAVRADGRDGHDSRVAWTVIGRLPVVQCVAVKRSGNALTGVSVKLESIGRRSGEDDCPSR